MTDETPPPSFLCPIMSELMRDPVTCTDGHSYERSNISRWLSEHDTSPITGTALKSASLIPNHALRNAIQDWEDERARRRSTQQPVSTRPPQPSPPTLHKILPDAPVLVAVAHEAAADGPTPESIVGELALYNEPVELEAPSEEIAPTEAEEAPPVDVGTALVTCRRLVGDPAFVALTSAFVRKHCGSFDATSEENKLEHTTLHEEYVALVEAELVAGLHARFGEAFDMRAFLSAVPAHVETHGGSAHSEALLDKTGEVDETVANLPETINVLNRFTSFADFKAEMLAAKARQEKQAAAMAAGAAKLFSLPARPGGRGR